MDLFRCGYVFALQYGLNKNHYDAFTDYYHQSKRIEGNIHRSYTAVVIAKVDHRE
jgi:hypothetical protein